MELSADDSRAFAPGFDAAKFAAGSNTAGQGSDTAAANSDISDAVYDPLPDSGGLAHSLSIEVDAGPPFFSQSDVNVEIVAFAEPGAPTIVVVSSGQGGELNGQFFPAAQVTNPTVSISSLDHADHSPKGVIAPDVVVTLSVAVEVVTLQPPGTGPGEFALELGVLLSDGAAAESDVQLFAQTDATLIRLDQFRSDIRFTGIDGSGVSVVVIDTGIDLNHSYFGADANSNGIADRIVYSYDFSGSNDSNASDNNGHGSNVASIIGSQDATYTGMAPGVNIIVLKVFPDGATPLASALDIAEALNWVIANRATYNIVAVNMSLGQGDNGTGAVPSFYSSQFATLVSNNVVNVVASGNSYYQYQSQGVASPSSDPNAWSIGAVWDRNAGSGYGWSSGAIDYTTGADRIISFSQRSTTNTTIFAPGGQITGASATDGTVTYSGTSQAAPHIAGLIADMQELSLQVSGRLLSVLDLKTTMQSSGVTIFDGDDENDNVANSLQNYKRVDAYAWGIAVLDKLFAGTSGDDALVGTAASDTIYGQAGNDRFTGGAGNDILDGGAGTDTAVFSGARSAYTLTNLGAGSVRVSGIDGTDTLSGIERLVFSDQTVAWPPPGTPTIISGTLTGTVIEILDRAVGENTSNLSASGTFTFGDIDLADVHTVTAVAKTVGAGYPSTFVVQKTDDSTGDGTGTISWTYTVNDASLDRLGVNDTVIQVYTITIDDGTGNSNAQDITITLTGRNDAPTITSAGVTTGSFTEIADGAAGENATTLTTTGTIAFADVDLTDAHVVTWSPGGAYLGFMSTSLTNSATGDGAGIASWTYSVADSQLDRLGAGEIATEIYTVYIIDGTTSALQTITITLAGKEDAPTITSAVTIGGVAELSDGSPGESTGTLTSTGTIAFADVDLTDSHAVTVTPVGSGYFGSLAANVTNVSTNDGAGIVTWTYTVSDSAIEFLNAGQQLFQNYTVVVDDGHGGSVSRNVAITLNGRADSPTITSNGGGDNASVSVAENTTAATTVFGSDPDAGAVVTYSIVGGADQSKFAINSSTGALSFVAAPDFEKPGDADSNNTYIVQVRASDGSLTDTQTITVGVTDAVGQTINGDGSVNSLSGSPEGDTLSGLGGADTLRGFAGNDLLNGGTGADTMEGGTGDDTYVVDDAGDVVTEKSGAAFVVPAGWTLKGTADFNNDGELDAIGHNASHTSTAIWLLQNGAIQSTVLFTDAASWPLTGVGDFNGDGYKDILYRNAGNPNWNYVIYLNGTTQIADAELHNGYMTPDAVQPLAGGNEGTDTVQSSISYTLGTGVENLTLLAGAGSINGTGTSSANVIIGNEGDNILTGKAGADTLTGGLGIDTFAFGAGDTGAALGQRDLVTDFTIGTDKIDLSLIDADNTKAGENDFRFLGTAAFDGQGGALRSSYDAGRNLTVVEADINGDRAADFAIELTGNKTLTTNDFTPGSLLLPVNLTGDGNPNTLTGGELGDTLYGLGNNDTLRGFAGNDLLDGGTGADTMEGGTGDDTYVVDDAGDVVTEVTGIDLVRASINYTLATGLEDLTLVAGAGSINGTGNAAANVIIGNEGDNILTGKAGVDTLTGGTGIDTFGFGAGDTGAALGQRDLITDFTAGTDKLDLSLIDADSTKAGENDFRFLGTVAFDGQGGALRYSYDSARGVTVLEADLNGDRAADFAIEFTGNKTLTANDFTPGSLLAPVNLTGDGNANTLAGGEVNDTLYGMGGNDTLRGFAGNDLLDGGVGADVMEGGTGDDTYVVNDAGDVVTEKSGAAFVVPAGWTLKGTADFNNDGELDAIGHNGAHTSTAIWLLQNGAIQSTVLFTDAASWPLTGVGDFNGDGQKDILYRNAGNPNLNYIIYLNGTTQIAAAEVSGAKTPDPVQPLSGGNEGTDLVQASISHTLGTGLENLTLAVGAGNINGTGNGLDNVITGNEGDNILIGKAGVDTLTGGAGIDTFGFGAGDTGAALGKRDVVTDFTVGADKLDLSLIDADTTRAGENDFRFLGTAAFDGQGGALRYSYDGARNVTLLEADTNGDRTADFAIELTGNKTLTTNDFTSGSLLAPVNLTGDGNANTLVGGEIGDTLSGLGGNDTLRGFAGNDLLDGGTDADVMEGGEGDDIYVVDDAGDVVTEVTGIDLVRASISYTLATGLENLTLLAGAGNINGTGNAAANIIIGNEGDNTLTGKAGVDTLTGGLGIDTFVFGAGDTGAALGQRDLVTDFTVGTDKLDLSLIDADTTKAGENDFRFLATAAFDGQGGALRYSYDSARGVTVLEADLNGDRAADLAIEFTGNKAFTSNDFTPGTLLASVNLAGDGNANTLAGGEVNDTLYGMGGNDTLRGFAGNDLLDGGIGADTMEGGTGDDTYVVDDAGDMVTERSGAAFVAPTGWTLRGTADFNNDGELDAIGHNANHTQVAIWLLQGGAVLSTVSFTDAASWPLTGVGDFNGDGQKDILYRNAGNPNLNYIIYLNGTTQIADGEVSGFKTPDPVQPLGGGNEGTDLVQSSISYTLATGLENLTLAAGAGSINGTGNAAANIITGNEGDNVLTGKAGVDTLTGGLGIDAFAFGAGDTGAALGQRDLVTDFTIGTDKIDLSLIDADSTKAGENDFRLLGTTAFDGQGGALRYSYDGARNVTLLEADTNGDRAADFAIEFTGNKAFTSNDFTSGSLLLPVNLTGDGNPNTLTGGELGDTLYGLGNNDTLRGFAGNDLLDGGTGADTMEGGTGDDTYMVDDTGDVVTERLTAAFVAPMGWTLKATADFNNDGELDAIGHNANHTQVAIWLLQNGAIQSTVSFTDAASWPLTGVGDFNGDGQKDILYRNAGNPNMNYIIYLNGTTQISAAEVSGFKTPDAVQPLTGGNEGIDLVRASISYTLGTGVEDLTLVAGAGNISGTGNAVANVITGNEGNNVLTGNGGVDTFVFKPNFGHDHVADYHAGQDILQFEGVFTNFNDLLAHTADDGLGNTVITANANDAVTLDGVTKAILQQHASDFHII